MFLLDDSLRFTYFPTKDIPSLFKCRFGINLLVYDVILSEKSVIMCLEDINQHIGGDDHVRVLVHDHQYLVYG